MYYTVAIIVEGAKCQVLRKRGAILKTSEARKQSVYIESND
jgi:hypothetical protein